ncbi:sulfurtransferase complex subunit TusC [Paraferrimonas sp. SM1919]|uniref:sulfurtransferase complex subunit TusC n=1 Tax=Paraferrimonas sp. SM1919 TaxID=2662263 RepID=UPI0013D55CDB|nr:sulfurtransferase complex subunit TusC [Paraferrimonas sp. SM1919]
MKSVVYIFTSSPFANSKGREGLEAAMLCASYEQQVTLIFIEDGVYHILPAQTPESIGQKDYLASLKALPFYDIEDIYVCQQSANARSITVDDTQLDVEFVDNMQMQQCLRAADQVVVF